MTLIVDHKTLGAAEVDSTRVAPKPFRTELVMMFEKKMILMFLFGINCKETAYAGIQPHLLSIQ